jgi:hypothetical protein
MYGFEIFCGNAVFENVVMPIDFLGDISNKIFDKFRVIVSLLGYVFLIGPL